MLKSLPSLRTWSSTSKLFQNGFLWPGARAASMSPVNANRIVALAFGGGVVSNRPTALRPAPRQKRYLYRLPGFSPPTFRCTVKSLTLVARSEKEPRSPQPPKAPLRRTSSLTGPRRFAFAHRIAEFELISEAETPNLKPLAAGAAAGAARATPATAPAK